MKYKFLFFLAIISLFYISIFHQAIAQDIFNSNAKDILEKAGGENFKVEEVNNDSVYGIIGNAIEITLGILGILLFLLMIYAGFLWFTSNGNDDQITKAKAYLKDAIIGLFIILMAYSITYFVMSNLDKVILG